MLEPPINKRILIWAPNTLGIGWFPAIYGRQRGRNGNRWKVFDYPGKTNVAHPCRDFQPAEWKELPDEKTQET